MTVTVNMISGMPQMSAAFQGWFQAITLQIVTQNIVDGLLTKSYAPVNFRGTIQPLSEKAIELKPEGQRAWTWLQIHCQPPAPLNINDVIVYNGQNFKVMALKDYTLNGYIEYHAVADYQP